MAEIIQGIFVDPPIAIARLGGSSTPQAAYTWVASPNPRSPGETTIAPAWSLSVEADGSVEPFMPTDLRFRANDLIRPVCPFLEVWALLGEPGSDPSTWREEPLTPELLAAHGATVAAVTIRVEAKNFKAARRAGNPALRFGTFPPVTIRGDQHDPVPLLGVSPPGVTRRMIPTGRSIPLGSVQVIRSRVQPPPDATPWSREVNVAVVRLRFTPARGHSYGPPATAQARQTPRGGVFPVVSATRAFLNPQAGWAGAPFSQVVVPGDTFDGAETGNGNSFGVVDDTCEARIDVQLALGGGRSLAASASVFVGPPDFAPDRRPFLSVADELNDRQGDASARSVAMTAEERDAWVQDLFERVYETVALFNVDHYRDARSAQLQGSRLAPPIPEDAVPAPTRAMGGRDALRNRLFAIAPRTSNEPLPMTRHARTRHRVLSDLQALRDFVAQSPGRLAQLVRAPFEVEPPENPNQTTMRMPPFMRQSNAEPLTLAAWQYELLMEWVRAVETSPQVAARRLALRPAARRMPDAAARRRAEVLERLRVQNGRVIP
jgi:hypothetical protein